METTPPSLVGVAHSIGARLRYYNHPPVSVGTTPVSVATNPVSMATNLASQVTDPAVVAMEIWTLTSEDSGRMAEMDYDPCCDPDDL